MVAEHEEVGRTLEHIRALAGDFVPPAWSCTTVRVLFAELLQLEAEIHRHVHLENHALFGADLAE